MTKSNSGRLIKVEPMQTKKVEIKSNKLDKSKKDTKKPPTSTKKTIRL